jgi:hypothetical protein
MTKNVQHKIFHAYIQDNICNNRTNIYLYILHIVQKISQRIHISYSKRQTKHFTFPVYSDKYLNIQILHQFLNAEIHILSIIKFPIIS